MAPNWLGDAVMSLPAVGMLGAARRANVAVIAPEATARVYWGLSAVDELVVLPKRGPTRGVGVRVRYLRKTRPDAAVLLPPSLSSAASPLLAGVRVRVGYRADGRGAALSDAVDATRTRDEHLTRNYVRLGEIALERIGLETPAAFETPAVRVAPGDQNQLDRIVTEAGFPRERPYSVIVPGATYGPAKSWPWQRYRQVARVLSRDNPVVLAGTTPEREVCGRIAHGRDRVFNLAGKTPLGAFLALLSRAAVVLANDSGSPHLAASLGTPVVVLFGSTSPRWTAPTGARVEVVRHAVPCAPCFRKTCPTQLECFDGITVEEVVSRAQAYL
jgi:heptosyltransferase-2